MSYSIKIFQLKGDTKKYTLSGLEHGRGYSKLNIAEFDRLEVGDEYNDYIRIS